MEQDIVDDRSPRGSLTQHSPTQESDRIALVDRDGTVARGAATSRAALSAAPCEDQPSRITLHNFLFGIVDIPALAPTRRKSFTQNGKAP